MKLILLVKTPIIFKSLNGVYKQNTFRSVKRDKRCRENTTISPFLRYQDRETLLPAGFELKDTEYVIFQDFPQEIIERRRKQIPKLKEAKKRGQKVSFSKSEPDKLFIDGKFISA